MHIWLAAKSFSFNRVKFSFNLPRNKQERMQRIFPITSTELNYFEVSVFKVNPIFHLEILVWLLCFFLLSVFSFFIRENFNVG